MTERQSHLPRWMHYFYALVTGHYWLPCPICGRNFGGHELHGYLCTNSYSGESVCHACVDEAERRNRAVDWHLEREIRVPATPEQIALADSLDLIEKDPAP